MHSQSDTAKKYCIPADLHKFYIRNRHFFDVCERWLHICGIAK